MNIFYRYFCNKCSKEHEDFDEAVFCCAVSGAYLCGQCRIKHESRVEAEKCCRQRNLTGVKVKKIKENA